ncbi:MAG: aminoglycoside phosphotransferase family protein [Deltaproteobacteria bacterium]|nr:aminoglycoside phosphotransferase family protein [Deltaproteobacteria bacterium]
MTEAKILEHLFAAAAPFIPQGRVIDIREYGSGNVHDTFLVTVGRAHPALDSIGDQHFILQRLNTRVFRRPEAVMGNMRTVTEQGLARNPPDPGRRWELPRVLLTPEGRDLWVDPDGFFWRALSFIEGARTFDTIRDLDHAREVGWALGIFHRLLSDLPPDRLADTLPGFHETPGYLRRYDEVQAKHSYNRSPEADYGISFIRARRAWASVLEDAKAQGKLHLRPIHGDPKINNFMMDTLTGQAVSLIDLDTVKPGLVHYDMGDCLRSGANLQGEETVDLEAVRFDSDICRAILQGYLSQAREFLTENDYEYLYDAIRVIAFELGLRFFTDYLEGNVYFKARHEEHNLARALVQFKLTESIESQETGIRAIIRGLRRPVSFQQ